MICFIEIVLKMCELFYFNYPQMIVSYVIDLSKLGQKLRIVYFRVSAKKNEPHAVENHQFADTCGYLFLPRIRCSIYKSKRTWIQRLSDITRNVWTL